MAKKSNKAKGSAKASKAAKADKPAKAGKKVKSGASAGRPKKAAKLPKEVAGVRVPRQLRETGAAVADLLSNPVVVDVAAAALLAAAKALRERDLEGGAGERGSRSGDRSGALIGSLLAAGAADGVRKLADAAGRKAGGGRTEKD